MTPIRSWRSRVVIALVLLGLAAWGLVTLRHTPSSGLLAQTTDPATAAQMAQTTPIWQDIVPTQLAARAISPRLDLPSQYRLLSADTLTLRNVLAAAPPDTAQARAAALPVVALPMPDGSMAEFQVEATQVLAPELAAKYPQFTTYRATRVGQPDVLARLDWTSFGFHAMIVDGEQLIYINPYSTNDTGVYLSYEARHMPESSPKDAGFEAYNADKLAEMANRIRAGAAFTPTTSTTSALDRTYRLAVAATAEFTQLNGGTVEAVMALLTTMVNRANLIYERDLGIQYELVANNDQLIFTDANNDPFPNSGWSSLIQENTEAISAIIGEDSFDVGHLLDTDRKGGLAAVEAVCDPLRKGDGVSGWDETLNGDATVLLTTFAHELGHQFGATHTFNARTGACSGARSDDTPYEPGGGVTIMAYPGVCGTQNIVFTDIPQFHSASQEQMYNYIISGDGGTCGTDNTSSNSAPVVDAGQNYTIPAQTPFTLEGTASDPDGDPLSFSWEEFVRGEAPDPNDLPNTDADGDIRPIFRPYPLTSLTSRTFPTITNVLDRSFQNKGETLPTLSRDINFRFIARDGNGGLAFDTMTLSVDNSAGPFRVTAPTRDPDWPRQSSQTVTWNVANTNLAPVSCTNVDILFSNDLGRSFTTLLSNTPNDGSESVTLPDVDPTVGMIKVACSDNVFFDAAPVNVCNQIWRDDHEDSDTAWTVEIIDGSSPWRRFSNGGYSGQNYWQAISDDELELMSAESVLISPELTLSDDQTLLRFIHVYNMAIFQLSNVRVEAGDAGIVEISVEGGAWQQVPVNAFVSNGYNYTVYTNTGNILATLPAFSGNSNGAVQSVIDLGQLVSNGQQFQVRFRHANDRNIDLDGGTIGWLIDDVSLCDSAQATANITLGKVSSAGDQTLSPGDLVTYTITVRNQGSATTEVQVSDALPPNLNGISLNETVTLAPNERQTYVVNAALAGNTPYNSVLTNTARFTTATQTGTASARVQSQCVPVFLDTHEDGFDDWTTASVDRPSNNTEWVGQTDGGFSGPNYWFIASGRPNISGIFNTDSTLASQAVTMDVTQPLLKVTHAYTLESDSQFGRDGGQIEINVNDGGWQVITTTDFIQNGYTRVITTGEASLIAGESAFSGVSNGYIQSIVDLSRLVSQGDSVAVRFRHVTDQRFLGALPQVGWAVDDVELCGGEQQAANLSLNKTVSSADSRIQPGDTVTYTIVAANNSSETINNAQLVDPLSPFLTGTALDETVSIPANSAITRTVVATVRSDAPADTLVVNTAVITDGPSRLEAQASFRVEAAPAPSLSLSKEVTLAGTPARPGDTVTYTIVAANNGSGIATNVQLHDTLPALLSGTNLSVTVDIAAGDSYSATIPAAISGNISELTQIANTVLLTHTTLVTQASASFTVEPEEPDSFSAYLPLVIR